LIARLSPLAGKPVPPDQLIDVRRLIDAYFDDRPDPFSPAERVVFGTSGHRGSAFERSFNEAHVLAITQAICMHRKRRAIDGPLFLGIDTHALSAPARDTALEVLAANDVQVMIASAGEYTPTPAISHAILVYNARRETGLADGIVITPSHNPPEDGGFKYNPPNGGPADIDVTAQIAADANALLEGRLQDVRRIPIERARRASSTHSHDFLDAYVADLDHLLDFAAIRRSALHLGVDPLGGAGVHYWARIAERYALDLTVVSEVVDPTFRFMTLDWDGHIRMDPSSPYAMQRLLDLRDRFDVAFACDTDHDRHGIVTRSSGLLSPNHYLAVAIDYLFRHRPAWNANASVGKTVVSSALIDRVTARLGRQLYEVPVGFKWFVEGLFDGSLGFGGEESAGASFNRMDGRVWTTDKDGIALALLSAEIAARAGHDPGALYHDITRELGVPHTERIDAPATAPQKQRFAELTPASISSSTLAGERIVRVIDHAPGNGAPIGGIKAITENGWFAARPSGTEDVYKIYAESFRDDAHLQHILNDARRIVDAALE
jgi:phosphoglucomutase